MKMTRLQILGCLAMLASGATAGEMRGASEVAAGLPPALLTRIQTSPETYLDRAATIIAGYGGTGGIDAAGIDRYIAVARAEGRALRIGDLLTADLDNDGAVTADEVETLAPLLDARKRGRLMRSYAQGDADSDGVMTAGELQAVGERAGMRRMSEAAAAALQALLAFDLDGNGLVSSAELADVVAAAARIAPGPARVTSRES
jgi:hypothetical protein